MKLKTINLFLIILHYIKNSKNWEVYFFRKKFSNKILDMIKNYNICSSKLLY